MLTEKMLQARQLIEEKRYQEARSLLTGIDHPTAAKWRTQIDTLIGPESKEPTSGQSASLASKPLTETYLTGGGDLDVGVYSGAASLRPQIAVTR